MKKPNVADRKKPVYFVTQRRADTTRRAHWAGHSRPEANRWAMRLSRTDVAYAFVVSANTGRTLAVYSGGQRLTSIEWREIRHLRRAW